MDTLIALIILEAGFELRNARCREMGVGEFSRINFLISIS